MTVGPHPHDGRRDRTRGLLPRHPPVVRGGLRSAHRGPGGRLVRGAGRAQRPRRRADRVRQDTGRVPLGARPARGHATARRAQAPLPGPLRLSAQGPRRRRAAQPALAADRHPPGRAAARRAGSGHHRRDAHRRHPGRRAAPVPAHPAGRAGDHSGVAVPPAHLGRAGVAARGDNRDPRRSARRRRHEAGGAPGGVAGTARGDHRGHPTADRALGDRAPGRRGLDVPVRYAPGRGRAARDPQDDPGRGPGPGARPGRARRAARAGQHRR